MRLLDLRSARLSRTALHRSAFTCPANGRGLEVDDSYLFNLDGEEKGQVSKRRRTGSAANVSSSAQTAKNPELAVDASRSAPTHIRIWRAHALR